jgi:hypothetical protein
MRKNWRRWHLALAAILPAALAGCRGGPQLTSARFNDAPSLPSLYTVTAGQLEFKSDFELLADHRLIREMVAERDDIVETLGLAATNEKITVYLFRDAETYGEFLARYYPHLPARRAFFLETDTRLTVYAHWGDRVAEDLRHEVAHGYLHAAVPNLPLWLDEGLAEYFEVPRGQQGLNRPHAELLADMIEHNGWRPDLEKLERQSDTAKVGQGDYAEAWAWAYFLLQTTPERREVITGYLRDLSGRGAAEPLSARLRRHHAEPERSLVEFLTGLK